MSESLRGLSTAKGRQFVVVTSVFLVLVYVVAGMRLWAKATIGRRFLAHDYLAFAALVCLTGFAVDSILCVYPGTVGMHLPAATALGLPVMETTLKIFYTTGFIWITSTTLIKMSLLHFYRIVFLSHPVPNTRTITLQIAAYAIYASSVLYWLAQITLLLRICQPIALQWDPTRGGGHCGDITKQEISSAAMNMILDLSIVLLPMPMLWSLRMPLKKKLAISGVLSLGLLICVINAVRLALIVNNGSEDFTYTSADVGMFTGLEIYIGWACTSLPTLGPLFRREKIAAETHKRKYYVSRRGGTSKTSAKKSFGDSLLKTDQSFEPLEDNDLAMREANVSCSQQNISRTQEVHVTSEIV